MEQNVNNINISNNVKDNNINSKVKEISEKKVKKSTFVIIKKWQNNIRIQNKNCENVKTTLNNNLKELFDTQKNLLYHPLKILICLTKL